MGVQILTLQPRGGDHIVPQGFNSEVKLNSLGSVPKCKASTSVNIDQLLHTMEQKVEKMYINKLLLYFIRKQITLILTEKNKKTGHPPVFP